MTTRETRQTSKAPGHIGGHSAFGQCSGDELYFIRSDRAVKIGRSRNAKARFRRLQTVCPVHLELHAVLIGAGDDEGRWHLAFHNQRMHGEWFRWTPQIDRAIKAALAGRDWVSTVRQSIRPALRRPGFTAPMVARLTRRRTRAEAAA